MLRPLTPPMKLDGRPGRPHLIGTALGRPLLSHDTRNKEVEDLRSEVVRRDRANLFCWNQRAHGAPRVAPVRRVIPFGRSGAPEAESTLWTRATVSRLPCH